MAQTLKRSLTQSLIRGRAPEHNPTSVKTHIICTIGPATNNQQVLRELLLEGMRVVRCNFSHGDYDYHMSVINNAREAAKEVGVTCAIMLDTKGPEIRSGKFAGGRKEILVVAGDTFFFHPDESYLGDEKGIATSYHNLSKVVAPGNQILVDDGLVSFTVLQVHQDGRVEAKVDNSGTIGETKGINLPGCTVDLPALTEKDVRDIEFGVKMGVDMIAASFIRKAEDVKAIREVAGVREQKIMIISKIESQEGLDNFNDILEESDGIMVARGDLGVEIPIEKVATAQKMMIHKCNFVGKPVITATQMLESMVSNPRPTRAEATDVANAVFDGSDCVMLSGETAKGKYPVATVNIMSRISRQAEGDIDYRALYKRLRAAAVPPVPIPDTIASGAVKTQWDICARLIICLTESGNTARLVSKYRPSCPVLCVTSDERVARQLVLCRATVPFLVSSMKGTDRILRDAFEYAKSLHLIRNGDLVVLTSGNFEGVSGSTNVLRVVTVN
eukprot:TRINITY_DN151_c1_g1_i1.p1 TRINITY_DN151_c1_g1~~TRINITY_DN151_c1_g1_i1.p1  ORF type:complete len:502 (-),score=76.22 TRINITY_DN151_c1_g1_i1:60-1565(-)